MHATIIPNVTLSLYRAFINLLSDSEPEDEDIHLQQAIQDSIYICWVCIVWSEHDISVLAN